MAWEGWEGYNPYADFNPKPVKYEPKWEKNVDYNPDHQPSSSQHFVKDEGKTLLVVWQVKGLGVMTMRASSDPRSNTGKLIYHGMSIFTNDEIGYSPKL